MDNVSGSMNLSIKERLYLPSLLPQNGSYHDLVVIRSVGEKVKPSKEELESLGITVTPQGQLQGMTEENESVEKGFDFTAEEVAMVGRQLKDFEKQSTLNLNILGLFEKFVGAPTAKK